MLAQVLHLSRFEIHSLSWIIATLLLTLKLCQPCYYKERCYCLNIWSSLIGHDTCMRYGLAAAQKQSAWCSHGVESSPNPPGG